MNLSKLNKAVKSAIFLGVASTPFATTQVLAQSPTQQIEKEVERIQVTGSRINRTDMESSSPITVIDSGFIADSGFQSVEEILNSQPIIAGMNIGSTTNNGSGGSATVNLRGMGAQRTLVLLNGRRMVASGTGADASVDLNTIPVAMIKNIEILKDGASAVYGSDAIAGVINIITKNDFEGTEMTVEGSITGQGDGETGGFNILHGTELAGGNLVVGLQYSDRGSIIQSDRDFVDAGASSSIVGGSLGGQVHVGDGVYRDLEQDDLYDYTTDSYAQTPNTLTSVFSSFNKEIAGDTELSVDFMYTRRESKQQMAPQPAVIDLKTDQLDSKYTDHFRKDGVLPEELEYRRRMTDAGPRIYEQETDTYRASAGLIGYLDNGAQWDISATYGRNDSKDRVHNSIHAGNMEQSIYNNQDLWFSRDELDRAFLVSEDVIYTEENKGGNEQFILAAGYSGTTESDIGYAMGVESRYESGYYTPDEITQAGESTAAQQDPTSGNYSVQSVYGEVAVPVTDAFNVEAALRYDNYSTFGGATTWKLGATYQVTNEFMLRTVAATGFRAPNVSELYGGNSGSYDYLSNPWDDNQIDPQILVNYTSDENLKAEESESFTFGAVWEIKQGLSTTLDYWKFDVTNAITRVNVQAAMNNCFEGDTAACDVINITPEGDLRNLSSPLTNVGSLETSGIDWNVTYVGDIFRVTFDTTYLIDYTEDGIDYTGRIDGNMGGFSEFRSNLNVQANITDDLSVLYTAQYIHGMEGEFYGDEFRTSSVTYHNISASYNINDQWRVNGGIKNLLDQDPKSVLGGNDMGTVPSIYDVVGRTFFVSTSYKF
ncbi:TonB-dependent receptor [Thalassotalea sp. LPB0316]|uniref:TonB-dependent receptor n=1 Tax=Thalassotalea sp. LPB0316 TaxID=2769490 RepID=UPI00186967EB|nr:TonB-dependent receptor [Thalassotalea sp. LPB0316]QOL25851.1 TonB-dependent receptor [Thalassotalea sp. LPB0316]